MMRITINSVPVLAVHTYDVIHGTVGVALCFTVFAGGVNRLPSGITKHSYKNRLSHGVFDAGYRGVPLESAALAAEVLRHQ
jgi:hypothetical protein